MPTLNFSVCDNQHYTILACAWNGGLFPQPIVSTLYVKQLT
ncbi:hypothetical protein [Bartonella henselae]|nr:hypothetical protein [Bartonella henselae]